MYGACGGKHWKCFAYVVWEVCSKNHQKCNKRLIDPYTIQIIELLNDLLKKEAQDVCE